MIAYEKINNSGAHRILLILINNHLNSADWHSALIHRNKPPYYYLVMML